MLHRVLAVQRPPAEELVCGVDFIHRPLELLRIEGRVWHVRCLRCGKAGTSTRPVPMPIEMVKG